MAHSNNGFNAMLTTSTNSTEYYQRRADADRLRREIEFHNARELSARAEQTDARHSEHGADTVPDQTEEYYARGFNAGRHHYDQTQQDMGANPPRSGHRYDTPENNAWQFGYSHGWAAERQEHERARAVYETDHAEC